jgi:DnaJ-domain-containing protein 1
MSNFYRMLGVAPCAGDAEIKVAFRKLAKMSHPDLNSGDARAEKRFKDVNRAYATLRDPAARAAYNNELAHQSARMRKRWRSAAVTMAACFALTVSSGLLVAAWVQVEARSRIARELPPVEINKVLPLALGVSD